MKKVVGILSLVLISLLIMGCPQPTDSSGNNTGDSTENNTGSGDGNGNDNGGDNTPVIAPGIPSGITLTVSGSSVEVSWTAVEGATSYLVYCSTVNSSSGLTGEEVTTNAYTHEDDFLVGDYYFWVKAKNSAGSSDLSDASMTNVALNVDFADVVGTYNILNNPYETISSVTINADGSASMVSTDTLQFDPNTQYDDYTITAYFTDYKTLVVLAESMYGSSYNYSKEFNILYDVTGTKTVLFDGYSWYEPEGGISAREIIGDLTISKVTIDSMEDYIFTISHNIGDRTSYVKPEGDVPSYKYFSVEELFSMDLFLSDVTEYVSDDAVSAYIDSDLVENNSFVASFSGYRAEGLEELDTFSLVVTPDWIDENATLDDREVFYGTKDLFKAGLDITANNYPDFDTPYISLKNEFSFVGDQDIDSFSSLTLERKVPGGSWITIEGDYKSAISDLSGNTFIYSDETVEIPNAYIYRVTGELADGEEYNWISDTLVFIPEVEVTVSESNEDGYFNVTTYSFDELEGTDIRVKVVYDAPMSAIGAVHYNQILASGTTSITLGKPSSGAEVEIDDDANSIKRGTGQTEYYDVYITYVTDIDGTEFSSVSQYLRYKSYH